MQFLVACPLALLAHTETMNSAEPWGSPRPWHDLAVAAGLVTIVLLLGRTTSLPAVSHLNAWVLEWFVSIRTDPMTAVATVATSFFSGVGILVLGLITAASMWAAYRDWHPPVYVALVIGISYGLTSLLKLGFALERPPVSIRLAVESSYAYPSGHATCVSAYACAVAMVLLSRSPSPYRRRGLLWILVAILVALIASTRLYLGVHWLTDVIGGSLMGVAFAFALRGLLDRACRSGVNLSSRRL